MEFIANFEMMYLFQVTPKFCKQYARVGDVINKALLEYKEDVINGSFPDAHHSPYKISKTDANVFSNELQRLGLDKAASEAVQEMDTTKTNWWKTKENDNLE